MNELKLIAKNIQNKNLDKAIDLCKLYENENNKQIIYNFLGVINLIKKNISQAEEFFLKSHKMDIKFQD